MWEFSTLKMKSTPVIAKKSFKLKIDVDQEQETIKVEADADFSEGEEVIPAHKMKVDINIRLVKEADEEVEGSNDLLYVEFVRKPIDKEENAEDFGPDAVFNKFIRDISTGCRMFTQNE